MCACVCAEGRGGGEEGGEGEAQSDVTLMMCVDVLCMRPACCAPLLGVFALLHAIGRSQGDCDGA